MLNVFIGTISTFEGWDIPKNCVQVSEADYSKLVNEELMWEGDQLVPNPNYATILAQREAQANEEARQAQIAELKAELAKYDYIGVKIAMGVATKEEYANEIAITEDLRQQIRALESK